MRAGRWAIGVALAIAFLLPAAAQDRPGLDRAAVKDLVRELLREEPELVLEALQTLEKREREASEAQAAAALKAKRNELERSPGDLVLGNPDGDITLVEFSDYRCPYCKQAAEPVMKAVKADGKVRLVLKELPILGRDSVTAAQAALAADRQGKYAAMHDALMAHKGNLDEAAVMRIAGQVGLDTARLKTDMQRPDVQDKLKANLELARALDIRGTPAFIIGDALAPGAVDEAALKSMFAKARGG